MASRKHYLPGSEFGLRSVPVSRLGRGEWWRIHRDGLPALDFSLRPHHRFSHPECPYEVLYLGANLRTCLWEIFGDDVFDGDRVIATSRWECQRVSRIRVPELRVCAVSTERTRSVMGVDKASLLSTDLDVPQAWSLAVQDHPRGFQGLKYTSRFLDLPCLVLFGRREVRERLEVTPVGILNDLDEAANWLNDQQVALV